MAPVPCYIMDSCEKAVRLWWELFEDFGHALKHFLEQLELDKAMLWEGQLWCFLEEWKRHGVTCDEAQRAELQKLVAEIRKELVPGAKWPEAMIRHAQLAKERERTGEQPLWSHTMPLGEPRSAAEAVLSRGMRGAGHYLMARHAPERLLGVVDEVLPMLKITDEVREQFREWMAEEQLARMGFGAAPDDLHQALAPQEPPVAPAGVPAHKSEPIFSNIGKIFTPPGPVRRQDAYQGQCELRVNATIFYNAGIGANDARQRIEEASKIWQASANIKITANSVRLLDKSETADLLTSKYGVAPARAAEGYWNINEIPAGTSDSDTLELFFLNHISPLVTASGVTNEGFGIIHFNGKTSDGYTVAHEIGHALGLGHSLTGLMAPGDINFGQTSLSSAERTRARSNPKLIPAGSKKTVREINKDLRKLIDEWQPSDSPERSSGS